MSCICQGCGKRYRIDIMIPDDMWKKIKPRLKVEGAGLLCGSCIVNRLEKLNEYDAYKLEKLK